MSDFPDRRTKELRIVGGRAAPPDQFLQPDSLKTVPQRTVRQLTHRGY
jgi:hypothetical protein